MATETRISAIATSRGPKKYTTTLQLSKQSPGDPGEILETLSRKSPQDQLCFRNDTGFAFFSLFPKGQVAFSIACLHGRRKSKTDVVTLLSPIKPDTKQSYKNIKYHKLSGLNNRNLLSQSEGQNSKVKVLTRPCSL